jgi:hypothetical protein
MQIGAGSAVATMDPRIKSEGDRRGTGWRTTTTVNTLVIAGLDPAIHASAIRAIYRVVETVLPSVSAAELPIVFNTLVEVSHFKPDSRDIRAAMMTMVQTQLRPTFSTAASRSETYSGFKHGSLCTMISDS